MFNIPQCNPGESYLSHKSEIDEAISRTLNKGWFILGEEVKQFEKEFADYIGVRCGIGVANGTDAVSLSLRACGVGPGDEVITVSHTAVATVAAIEMAGAIPVLADIDEKTFTIDPDKLESLITKKTKAFIAVHLYGLPSAIDLLLEIRAKYGLYFIEDCSQAHGALFKNKKAGSWGDVAAFSLYPTKNLGALGDGGIIVTNNKEIAEKAKLLREYGWTERYISYIAGVNSRLDELQAAILRVKLKYLDKSIEKRQKIADAYNASLSKTTLTLPSVDHSSSHAYHQYVVRCKSRDALKEYLRSKGIGTLVHYPVPIHLQPAYKGRIKCSTSMNVTERVCKDILSLPLFPELSLDHVSQVVGSIISFPH